MHHSGTYLLKSRESSISRCFSFNARVASSPASFSSSFRLAWTGCHVVPAFLSMAAVDGGASGIVALMASF